MLQTEYPFTLPKGYVDADGALHKDGIMRVATVADEIFPMRDPRVLQNSGYLPILVFTRVITKLGDVQTIDTRVIESLFSTDFKYLQDFYDRINKSDGEPATICPHCGKSLAVKATEPPSA